MGKTLFILNDPPYGTERAYNALRLAGALVKIAGEEVKMFLLGDAASCAKSGQRVPEGFYNVQLMVDKITRSDAAVGVCGISPSIFLLRSHPPVNLRYAGLSRFRIARSVNRGKIHLS